MSDPNDERAELWTKLWPVIITAVLSCAATLGTAWLTFRGSQDVASADMLRSAYERMAELETRVADQSGEIAKLNARVLELQAQAKLDTNTELFLEEFIDGLPFPAWVKRVVRAPHQNVQFRMVAINKAYEHRHRISKRRYQGLTDHEVWPPDVARTFYLNDMQVLASKSAKRTIETYPTFPWEPESTSNPLLTRLVVKAYLHFLGGNEMIFGMAVPLVDPTLALPPEPASPSLLTPLPEAANGGNTQ